MNRSRSKLNLSKVSAMVMGTALVASALIMTHPSSVFAGTQSTAVANTVNEGSGTLYTANNYTKPDAPVTFTVNATPDVLNAMHLKSTNGNLSQQGSKSLVGVLITDGTHNYLATYDNGELSYTLNGSDVVLTANHPMLNRYTSYTAYLLTGDALNKYESMANSNGHSQAFVNMDKSNTDSVQFQTGSAVGEPSNWTITTPNSKPSVVDGATVTVSAVDDYGDLATSGSVSVSGASATDGTTLSDTFSAPQSVSLTNGQAVISLTNHKAQGVSVTVQTHGQYTSDSKSTTVKFAFQPGPAHSATMNSSESTMVAGTQDEISGQVVDIYGNPVNPTTMNFTASDGSVQAVTTGSNGEYNATFTAPTKLNQSQSLSEGVGVKLQSSVGDASNAVQMTVNPDKPSTSDLLTTSVVAGTQTQVAGDVKDQYGNLVLPTTVSASSSDGAVTSNTQTNNHGQFSLTFTAPKKLNQSHGVSENVNLNLNFQGVSASSTDSFAVNPDKPSKVVLNPISSMTTGTPVQISGSVTDQYGNLVADGTTVSLYNGSSLFMNATTKNGVFSVPFTPTDSTSLNLTASVGGISSAPVSVSVQGAIQTLFNNVVEYAPYYRIVNNAETIQMPWTFGGVGWSGPWIKYLGTSANGTVTFYGNSKSVEIVWGAKDTMGSECAGSGVVLPINGSLTLKIPQGAYVGVDLWGSGTTTLTGVSGLTPLS